MEIFRRIDIERYLSDQKLISQNSEAPNVYFFVILLILHYLWRNIGGSSTQRLSRVFALWGPTKVANLCYFVVNHNVFSFDVSVYNVLVVQVIDSRTNLSYDLSCIFFIKHSVFLKHLIKISLLAKLKNEIYCKRAWKTTVKLYYVRMAQAWVNFYLSDKSLRVLRVC